MKTTERFSDRVDDYVRYRPGYPADVVRTLVAEAHLTPASLIVDLGSGTGISAELFLAYGCTVIGVEPNAAMRTAAERLLAGYPHFRSVAATAEQTTLDSGIADFVVAAQAFHWFDVEKVRAEVARILRPEGFAVLLWNTRLTDATPFLRAYEDLLLEFGTDYAQAGHRQVDANRLAAFFGGEYRTHAFANRQCFGWEGLRGRLLSSSYVPNAGHPRFDAMIGALQRIFEEHQRDGQVCFEYRTEMFVGRVPGRG